LICELALPFIALAIVLLVMEAAVLLTNAIRSHDFRRFEDKSESGNTQSFPLPASDGSEADNRRKAMSPLLRSAHEGANAAQTVYHDAVVRSAGCLALAFLVLAFDSLRANDLPGWLNWEYLESLSSWIDALTIVFVLILFLYGRRISRTWIAGRAGIELLRQYQFLWMAFPSAFAAGSPDVHIRFGQERNAIATQVQQGPISEITGRIVQFWSARKAAIAGQKLAAEDLTSDAILVYLERRARRQLGWFIDSRDRLKHIAERRSRLLLIFYVAAAGIAVAKHGVFLWTGHAPIHLVPLLLIVTGMSAVMTAYYINQNSRSLIHRYNTQERTIAAWLTEFDARWNFAAIPLGAIDDAAKDDIRARILSFEVVMIDELLDWIHITSRDAIELSS
jgi:hypothetical protein